MRSHQSAVIGQHLCKAHPQMKKTYQLTLAAIMLAAFSHMASADTSTVGQDVKSDAQTAGHDIANGTKEVGHGIANGAKAVGHGVAHGAKSVGHATKKAAVTVGHGAKEVGHDIGHGAKEVGHGVATTTRKGWDATKDTVKGVFHKDDAPAAPPAAN